MSAGNFASYTRSTAFSLSLSAKMIDRVLGIWTIGDLASRYTWWTPPQVGGSRPGYGWEVSTTDYSLQRRGLLDINEERTELTRPGQLMAELLIEADFPKPARLLGLMMRIPAHPDDLDDLGGRHSAFIRFTPEHCIEHGPIELPRDRRLDLWQPGDDAHWDHLALTDQKELAEMKLAAAEQGAMAR